MALWPRGSQLRSPGIKKAIDSHEEEGTLWSGICACGNSTSLFAKRPSFVILFRRYDIYDVRI